METKEKKSSPAFTKLKSYKLHALFLGKERDYFVENLSLLVSSGMPITSALEAIVQELRSRRMKNVITAIQSDIGAGSPLWRALASANFFPERAISLIRLGEESGKLTENLKVVAVEQEKDRVFKSKLRSAMMYPVFVLSLTVVIGVGIAWFILPKLALVFGQLKIQLPLITKILIGVGGFLGSYGQYVVPAAILVMAALLFFTFSFSKTKFIGQVILFSIPGIKGLIKEVEVARFGYLLGTLLEAGLPITHALDSLASATSIARYQKLYAHLRDSVGDGNSIQKSFVTFKHSNRLIPAPLQQLVVAGERSGSLSGTLLKIGQMFETKADTTTKNLAIILEPILLVIVWLGVVAVALAVILPIYNLIGGFNQGTTSSASGTTENDTQASLTEPSLIVVEASSSEEQSTDTEARTRLEILATELGYLNVRDEPTRAGHIISTVMPGEVYEYTREEDGWYEIVLSEVERGWILGSYARRIETQPR